MTDPQRELRLEDAASPRQVADLELAAVNADRLLGVHRGPFADAPVDVDDLLTGRAT